MKVWQWGTFDVANFGDLLFPLIARRRLGPLIDGLETVSPTAAETPVWEGCLPAHGFSEVARAEESCGGVLLGGGHILAWDATHLEEYSNGPFSSSLLIPMIWLGATAQASRCGVPLCWNAPGLKRKPGGNGEKGLLRACLEASSYVSVRDTFSRDCLAGLGAGSQINVVPDTALEVSRLWKPAELDADHERLSADAGLPPGTETLAVHLNRHYAEGNPAQAAAAVDALASQTGLVPLIVALGPCHGDSDFAAEVIARVEARIIDLSRPSNIREVTAAIGRSRGYIGSSMHGMITALSFGLPGLLVADEGSAELNPKFSSLLEPLGLREQMIGSWSEAAPGWKRTSGMPPDRWREVLPSQLPDLDAHWAHIGETMAAGGDRRNDASEALQSYWQTALGLAAQNDFTDLFYSVLKSDPGGISAEAKARAKTANRQRKELKAELQKARDQLDGMERHWTHSLYRTATRWKRSLRKRWPDP